MFAFFGIPINGTRSKLRGIIRLKLGIINDERKGPMKQGTRHFCRRILILVLALTFLFTSGCFSIQWRDGDGNLRSAGLVHYSVIDTGQARVYVHRTAGLNVRLTSFDGGFTVGYRKQIAVQPCNATGCTAGAATGALWTKDPSRAEEGLYLRKTLGAEIGTDGLQNGLRLGFSRQAIIFGPRSNESVISTIKFSENNLDQAIYLEERGNQ